MAITKTNQPYEFLVRWKDGAITGAHIKMLETIAEDGVVLSQKEGVAMPVSMAGAGNFPLADLLTGIQTQALIDLDAARSELAAVRLELEQAVQPTPVTATPDVLS